MGAIENKISKWPKVPLEIRNEEIVGLSDNFCKNVSQIGSLFEVRNFLSNLSDYEQTSRIFTEVYPYQGLSGASGRTFNMKGLLNRIVPDNLVCSLRDAMIQFGPWWTRAPIEIGGNDTISEKVTGGTYT